MKLVLEGNAIFGPAFLNEWRRSVKRKVQGSNWFGAKFRLYIRAEQQNDARNDDDPSLS